MDIRSLVDGSQHGFSVTILAGHNGAGKSRYLQSLASHYAAQGKPVVVVCNTPFDRFRRMAGVKRVSASRGRRLAYEVLKSALTTARREGPTAFRTLSKTLGYCGYSEEIGIRVVGLDMRAFQQGPVPSEESQSYPEDLESAFRHATGPAPEDVAWLNFNDGDFRSLQQQSYAVLIEHESLLKANRAIRGFELLLKRRDGTRVPLLEASSGELTLISTLVYLSVEVKEESVVLIDEPENSLHPEWQKQYVDRLASILFYSGSKIFIATHAPIIVSGAQTESNLALRLFHVRPESVDLLDARSKSVEATLWEVFQTITPQNHFVSQALSQELADLANGKRSSSDVEETISKMNEVSFDPQQRRFFEGAQALAKKVAQGEAEDD